MIFFFCKSLLLARTLCWWLLSSSIIVIIICQHNLRPRHNFHGDTSNNWIFKWNSAEMTVFNLELSGGWCSMARIGISKKVCVFLWPELCWWHFYDSIVSDNRSQSRQSMLNVRILGYFILYDIAFRYSANFVWVIEKVFTSSKLIFCSVDDDHDCVDY